MEMWVFLRMQEIPWRAKRTNESVMMEVNRNATLMNKIRTQKARFIGHVTRRCSLEHLGKELEEDREKVLDGIARWLGQLKTIAILKDVEDKELWQRMICNANQ